MLDAVQPSIGAKLQIERIPLGAERTDAESRERLLSLAGSFDLKKKAQNSKEQLVSLLTAPLDSPEGRRERQYVDVEKLPGSAEFSGPGGSRYVQFAYDVTECTGPVYKFVRDDGVSFEDCDGDVLPRKRHFATATVLPTKYTSMRNNFLNSVEGSQDNIRFLESLWLLDISVPVDKVTDQLAASLARVGQTFAVQPARFEEE
eukprot:TRINITY_DN11603_c0_g1_i1.p1 TRINITY_DN11603_c0_g1~~TRINITY_DN11603_c0_g1_i1.p1  ORF type:complete len:203 (+),score=37.57 TRINITY_DN11603_c0_g1_i1:224-832(+)